jgi:hypothetical protein
LVDKEAEDQKAKLNFTSYYSKENSTDPKFANISGTAEKLDAKLPELGDLTAKEKEFINKVSNGTEKAENGENPDAKADAK